ncbi:MAG: serine hydrolase family protein [Rhodocyclaceae bacterium]|nr:serine hydrolase family protein [Rhodocyclaceae bacterium]
MNATLSMPGLVVPGLGGSGPGHWQSLWQATMPELRRLEPRDWDAPCREEWLQTLSKALAVSDRPMLVIAHSLGCALLAHWGARSGLGVAAALLVAPADVDSPAHTPAEVRSFAPMPLLRLPFPAVVVASRDDPYVPFARARQFAAAWGCRLVDAGPVGHINADSDLGHWPAGRDILAQLDVAAAADRQLS